MTRLNVKEVHLSKPYSLGTYDKSDANEQWIRITEGCPNQCAYCAEPAEIKVFPIPEIVRNLVKILDMNLLSKKEAIEIIEHLGKQKVNGKVVRYELVCGIDYRFLTQELADALHNNRFIKIRLAWDGGYDQQFKIQLAIRKLLKAGYKTSWLTASEIMLFMIGNYKISFEECCKKLELCKVWGVRVADCWFDNQLSPNIKPIYWTAGEIKTFRRMVRKHNQLVDFGIDPELPVKQFNSLTGKQEANDGNADKDKREDTRLPDVQGERTMEAAAVHVLVDERGTDRTGSQRQDRGLHEESATGGRVN